MTRYQFGFSSNLTRRQVLKLLGYVQQRKLK